MSISPFRAAQSIHGARPSNADEARRRHRWLFTKGAIAPLVNNHRCRRRASSAFEGRAPWIDCAARKGDILISNRNRRQGSDHTATTLDHCVWLSLIHISEPTRQAEISYAVFCLK